MRHNSEITQHHHDRVSVVPRAVVYIWALNLFCSVENVLTRKTDNIGWKKADLAIRQKTTERRPECCSTNNNEYHGKKKSTTTSPLLPFKLEDLTSDHIPLQGNTGKTTHVKTLALNAAH